MRGRGFVSLGIIVSKLHVRYFQPGTGTAISASITLLFLFSYVFHFPADHPFNNPPSPLPFIPAVLRVRANLVTKKTRNFPNQRTFLKRSRISISDDFPRVRGGGRERGGPSIFTLSSKQEQRSTLASKQWIATIYRATITKPKISDDFRSFESDTEEKRVENSIRLARRLFRRVLFDRVPPF